MWLLNKNLHIAFSNKTEYDDTKQLQNILTTLGGLHNL